MSQSVTHAMYDGTRAEPSKCTVRKLMPMRSWHSVAVVASEWYIVCISGNISFIIARPASVAAMRGSVCWVAASGGGTGAPDSQSRSERNCGSAATSWLSAVVPVRGRPITNTGPSTTCSPISGCCAVRVLHLEARGQMRAEPDALHHLAHLGEVGFLVHRRDEALQPLAV